MSLKTIKELAQNKVHYATGYNDCKKDVLKLIDAWRESMRDSIFKWGIEEGGDKLHYNEIADEHIQELKERITG